MTYKQFWYDNPKLLIVYQKAYYNKIHEEAHLQGQYNCVAMEIAIANAFRKKGQKPEKYIDKPDINKYFEKPISREQTLKEYRKNARNQMRWVNALSNN